MPASLPPVHVSPLPRQGASTPLPPCLGGRRHPGLKEAASGRAAAGPGSVSKAKDVPFAVWPSAWGGPLLQQLGEAARESTLGPHSARSFDVQLWAAVWGGEGPRGSRRARSLASPVVRPRCEPEPHPDRGGVTLARRLSSLCLGFLIREMGP